MALIRFFKVPKHKQFNYKTRFWDPDKEELQERLRLAEDRKRGGVEGSKARILTGFRNKGSYTVNASVRKRQAMRSNLILLGMVIFLLIAAYLFMTEYLPRIISMLERSNY